MTNHYKESEIVKGDLSHSGHVVFKKAKIAATNRKVIYKLNKYGIPILSQYEVALSNVLRIFLQPHLSPPETVVKNSEDNVVGLLSEHVCYAVEAREGLDVNFFVTNYDTHSKLQFESKKAESPEDIPVYFLNQFRPGFFADLFKAHQEKQLNLDMDSLASVLCASYTLEEDDLHKGNLGFYIVEHNNIKRVVFFKIDNDLLMSDSVMSHFNSRIVNWRFGENAFKISARDLREFPKLQDSKNHYWPTSKRFFVNFNDPKAYTNSAEIDAFIALGKNEAFQKAKWRAWYKHILIQSTEIRELSQGFDANDPKERAQLNLVVQAAVGRLSYLKATLFSLPEFRKFVQDIDPKEMVQEVQSTCGNLQSSEALLERELNNYQLLCQQGSGFVEGDTPLHVAIRLGDYRYQETWGHFREFANQTNANNETPLDVAMSQAIQKIEPGSHLQPIHDVRQNPSSIASHLLNQGVNRTKNYKLILQQYPELKLVSPILQSEYLNKAKEAKTAEELLVVLRDLGEDSRLCLKMKKEISVYCVRYFLKNKKYDEGLSKSLTELQQALNGSNGVEPRPELQFIRQLRSSLWIVRIIRGLLGGTSTQVELNNIITNAKENFPSSSRFKRFSCCFFAQKAEDEPISQVSASSESAHFVSK